MSQWWDDDEVDEPAEQPGAGPPGGYVPPPGPSPAAAGGDMPTYGAAPQPVGQHTGTGGGSGGGVPWGVAIAAVLALIGGLLAFNSLSGDDEQVLVQGEIVLERADEAGADPFFDDYATLVSFDPNDITPPTPSVVPVTEQPDGAVAPTNPAPTTQAALTNAEILQLSFKGSEPGLYGGTGNSAACNKAALIAFLETTPAKATAWAGAQGIPATGVREFVEGLTTVALQADTRVTNHGFKNGVANPIQSVLQTGTAVMIDETGIPRVKCGCGNPLLKPIPQTKTVVLKGEPWPAFDQTAIATIEPADTPVATFVLADAKTGNAVERPAGTDGEADTITNIPAPRPTDELIGVGAAGGVSSALGGSDSTSETAGETESPDTTTTIVDRFDDLPPVEEVDSEFAPPASLAGGTYCEKYVGYVNEAEGQFNWDLEEGSPEYAQLEAAWWAFVRRAIRDLRDSAPPELQPGWAEWDRVYGQADNIDELFDLFEQNPNVLDEWEELIDEHAERVCGLEF